MPKVINTHICKVLLVIFTYILLVSSAGAVVPTEIKNGLQVLMPNGDVLLCVPSHRAEGMPQYLVPLECSRVVLSTTKKCIGDQRNLELVCKK